MADDDSIEGLFACQAENDADSAPRIISRKDAIALGFVTYFTGKPCKHGHIAEKRVDNGRCVCCVKAYRADNKEAIKAYRANNKEPIAEYHKTYYVDNKEAIKAYQANNKEIIAEYQKAYRADNKEAIKAYRADNKEAIKAYRADNKEAIAEYQKVYVKQRKQTDIQYWLAAILRTRLCTSVKNNQKSGSAVRDLGCSIEFLKQHLEQQFKDRMTWENRGKVWHIDHIAPLCSFDLEDREQLLIACHYTNLQPLFGPDNLKKSAEDKKKKFKPVIDPNYSCLIELDLLEDENPAKED